MSETVKTNVAKQKLMRCIDWLQKQNNEESTKLSLQNKNDIQFIIQTNAARKNFLLSAAEDEATVPNGVEESVIEPNTVSLYRLRVKSLNMECEWQSCKIVFNDYEKYQDHVRAHTSDVHVIEKESGVEYVCLWDICGHKTPDFNEMVRHMNYHAYHGKLLAIGLNGRATLKLVRCKKDSTKRNLVPIQSSDYCCMWIDCDKKFNAVQTFLDHVKLHTNYAEKFICSWAGCGAVFPKRGMLDVHIRSHTGERLIACYHCGQHFANNRKLCDHSRRQNLYPTSSYACELCGARCATAYLLGEHTRQHVCMYACSLCDMSAPSPAALAHHVRYRHLEGPHTRPHACPHCPYKAVTKWDLRQHIPTHKRKKSKVPVCDKDISDDDNSESEPINKKRKSAKKYACHMCPEKEMKIFSRGTRLTTHLVKVHGAQWSYGHSRFRYQVGEDGLYRLTTTRFESLEVSTKIVDSYSGPKKGFTNFEFNLKQVAEPTATTPRCYEVTLKNSKDDEDDDGSRTETGGDYPKDNEVEITMCDVDEKGNIISSEVITSEFVYTQ